MPQLSDFIQKRVRSYQKRVSNKYRQITWNKRALPNFIIIGAQKAGTTSLFYYLSQHPQLIPSDIKEVHYFDGGFHAGIDQYRLGIQWYCTHFPLRSQVSNGHQTYEASPSYLFHPLVAQRIYQVIPDVKLIALLRNPTDRAISHYLHEKRRGVETLSIREAFEQEDERLKPAFENQEFNSIEFRRFSYKSRGFYKSQLLRYFEYFPKENLLILPSERFFSDPETCLQLIYRFVGIDSTYQVKDLQPKNVAPNKIKVDQGTYDYLNDFFRPYNEELYELLGEDFGW